MVRITPLALTVPFWVAAIASAQVILQEQVRETSDLLIRSATDQRLADNFTPIVSAPIIGLNWWGLYATTVSDDWLIELYNDVGTGGVGTSIHQEVVSTSDILISIEGNRRLFEFTFSAPVNVAVGTQYWLSVYRFGPGNAFVWSSSIDGDLTAMSSNPDFDPDGFGTFALERDVAWQLVTVPTAPTGAMLMAVAAMGPIRRRR